MPSRLQGGRGLIQENTFFFNERYGIFAEIVPFLSFSLCLGGVLAFTSLFRVLHVFGRVWFLFLRMNG